MKSKFLTRALTGAIFVIVLVGCILAGPITFSVLFAIICAMTVNEFCNIIKKSGLAQINKPISILAGVYLFLSFSYLEIAPGKFEILIPYLLLIIYLLISELYLLKDNSVNNMAYAFMAQLYIALPFALLNTLAFGNLSDCSVNDYIPVLPLSIFIFTWVNDSGAYCVGVLFGKHRLFERISPKKSWEGSFGGGIFTIVSSIIVANYFPVLSVMEWVGLALTVVVFGTWGDLVESLIKRSIGIKDSGNILPGHGGMLDRFDSTLLAIPASVLYLYLITLL